MTDQRTHLLGAAFILAMVIALLVATIVAVLAVPKLVRHAGCVDDPITIAALAIPFKGTYGP